MKFQQGENLVSNIQLNTIIDELKKLIESLLSEDRKKHTLGVINFSMKIVKKLGLNDEVKEKILVAALAHDIFRDIPEKKLLKMSTSFEIKPSIEEAKKPILLHSKVAAEFLKRRFGIKDIEILEAVEFHTSGKKDMGLIAKIIFVADSLEESRSYNGVEKLRELVLEDFDMGFFKVLKNKLSYVISNNLILLKDSTELWNDIILKGVEKFESS